jgi:endonuclease IV
MLTPDSSDSSESSEFDLAARVAQIENQNPFLWDSAEIRLEKPENIIVKLTNKLDESVLCVHAPYSQ